MQKTVYVYIKNSVLKVNEWRTQKQHDNVINPDRDKIKAKEV